MKQLTHSGIKKFLSIKVIAKEVAGIVPPQSEMDFQAV